MIKMRKLRLLPGGNVADEFFFDRFRGLVIEEDQALRQWPVNDRDMPRFMAVPVRRVKLRRRKG